MLNSPNQVPNPKKEEVQSAIDLLTVLGRNTKDAKQLLSKMLEVQTYNDKVYAQATGAKKEAEDAIKHAKAASDKLSTDVFNFRTHQREEILKLNEQASKLKKELSESKHMFMLKAEELELKEFNLNRIAEDNRQNEEETGLKLEECNAYEKKNRARDRYLENRQLELNDIFKQLRNILPK